VKLNSKGFTLIEILIVITIAGVLGTWYTSSNLKQRQQQNLLEATATTRSYLDHIRHKSTSVLIPAGISVAENYKGHGFEISGNIIKQIYSNNGSPAEVDLINLNRFKNIELALESTPSGFSQFVFQRSSGYLKNLNEDAITVKLILKNTKITKCSSLSINNQGIIITNDNETCP